MIMKIQSILQNKLVLITALVVTLLLSLFSVLLFSKSKELLLFYPLDGNQEMEAELRIIPRGNNKENQMENLLKELLLHPVHPYLNPIVPQGVRIKSLIYDHEKKYLYVDLSTDIIIIQQGAKKYPEESIMLQMLQENLMFHFPYLEKINFTIEGLVPQKPMYIPSEVRVNG
jgi:hypothetical protein